MATQKFKMSKMMKHEKGESKAYEMAEEGMSRRHMDETNGFEKKEERMAKEHFSHGGPIPADRQKHYTKGTHAIDSREAGGM